MVTVAALAAGLVLGVVAGGRLRLVGRRRIRQWWLVAGGAGLQAVSAHVPSSIGATAAMAAGYACLLAFVYANRLLVGTGVIAAGLVFNAAVVTVDGGMPVNPGAIAAAGLAPAGLSLSPLPGSRHHLEGRDDHLTALDDRYALPALHQVVSAGDLVLAVGLADAAFHLTMPMGLAGRRRRLARRRRLRRAATAAWSWLQDLVVQPAAADALWVGASYYGTGRRRPGQRMGPRPRRHPAPPTPPAASPPAAPPPAPSPPAAPPPAAPPPGAPPPAATASVR